MKNKQIHALAALLLAATASSQAAFITVDDSDPNTIKITAGDFEEGFFVDGNFLTSGLGNSASVTLPDTGHTFAGTYIDLGANGGGMDAKLYFADAGDPTSVKSGIDAHAVTDDFFASLTGNFYGYNGSTYLVDPSTFSQNGGVQFTGLPFLSISFTPERSETSAPDGGSTALLMGLAVAGLGSVVRRTRN